MCVWLACVGGALRSAESDDLLPLPALRPKPLRQAQRRYARPRASCPRPSQRRWLPWSWQWCSR